MRISEQPGRYFAVIVVGPVLIYKGIHYDDYLLLVFGIIFMIYEMLWIQFAKPKEIKTDSTEEVDIELQELTSSD